MLKKIISILLFVSTLLLIFSACGVRIPQIEDCEWQMRYIMHGENHELIVDAVKKKDNTHPEAKIIDMTLTAKDGIITITDATNQKTYTGTYSPESKTPDGTNYEVTIDDKTGYAIVAMTTYANGTEEPTLPINLGDFSLYFYAK